MTYRMILVACGLTLAGCVSQDDQKAEATQSPGLSQTEIAPSLTDTATSAPYTNSAVPYTNPAPAASNAPAAPAISAASTGQLFPAAPQQPVAGAAPPATNCKTTGDTTVCTANAAPDPDSDRYNTN